jgi:prepilin-type N-terminal cleavage/methylation domain-containing protein
MTSIAKRRSFTLVEILVAVAIIAILVAMTMKIASGVFQRAKIDQTRRTMSLLAEAVNAFHDATSYYPLAVPEDAWGDWANFDSTMKWDGTTRNWKNYFIKDTSNEPDHTWPGSPAGARPEPTNIHMLVFQLEQVPESDTILNQLKKARKVDVQQAFGTGAEQWLPASSLCEIAYPLDPANTFRKVYQPQDGWGIPLRYWSADILQWADPPPPASPRWTSGVLTHLKTTFTRANWGFFIESAGLDGKFGWWGSNLPAAFNSQQTEDNLYSFEGK